MDRLVLRNRRR